MLEYNKSKNQTDLELQFLFSINTFTIRLKGKYGMHGRKHCVEKRNSLLGDNQLYIQQAGVYSTHI